MLPTTVNALFILIGSLAGLLLRRGINEKLKLAILDAMGLSAFGIGIHSLVNGMDQSGYPVHFIVSLAIGALIGNWIDFGLRLERLVARFQSKGSAGTFSLDGLITAFLIFCVGPLAILGPIKSALENDDLGDTRRVIRKISDIRLSHPFHLAGGDIRLGAPLHEGHQP